MTKTVNKIYCQKCGRLMLNRKVPADKYCEFSATLRRFVTFPRYDRMTGEKILILEYYCVKKRWWNNHDVICGDKLYRETKSK